MSAHSAYLEACQNAGAPSPASQNAARIVSRPALRSFTHTEQATYTLYALMARLYATRTRSMGEQPMVTPNARKEQPNVQQRRSEPGDEDAGGHFFFFFIPAENLQPALCTRTRKCRKSGRKKHKKKRSRGKTHVELLGAHGAALAVRDQGGLRVLAARVWKYSREETVDQPIGMLTSLPLRCSCVDSIGATSTAQSARTWTSSARCTRTSRTSSRTLRGCRDLDADRADRRSQVARKVCGCPRRAPTPRRGRLGVGARRGRAAPRRGQQVARAAVHATPRRSRRERAAALATTRMNTPWCTTGRVWHRAVLPVVTHVSRAEVATARPSFTKTKRCVRFHTIIAYHCCRLVFRPVVHTRRYEDNIGLRSHKFLLVSERIFPVPCFASPYVEDKLIDLVTMIRKFPRWSRDPYVRK